MENDLRKLLTERFNYFRSSGFKKYDERISLELDENGDTWMINLGFGNQHHLTILMKQKSLIHFHVLKSV